MKNLLKTTILFFILTILTQVGGLIYVFIKLIITCLMNRHYVKASLKKIIKISQKLLSQSQWFLELCVQSNLIKRIYLEPHLQTRLGFTNSNKIRRTGCNAVRHDDHIHIQL